MRLCNFIIICTSTIVTVFALMFIGTKMGVDDDLIYMSIILGILVCIRLDLADILDKQNETQSRI